MPTALDVPSAVPDLTILCYPVVPFTDAVRQGSIDNLLGQAPSSDMLRAMSPELNITHAAPPAFLWHTADDEAGPDEWTALCAKWLARQGWTPPV